MFRAGTRPTWPTRRCRRKPASIGQARSCSPSARTWPSSGLGPGRADPPPPTTTYTHPPMLIPVGDTLRGCPTRPAPGALPDSAMPYLGVSCPVGNSIACDRVGIGVTLARPATLVTVQLAGRTVALSPPPADSPGCDCWLGYLSPAGCGAPDRCTCPSPPARLPGPASRCWSHSSA